MYTSFVGCYFHQYISIAAEPHMHAVYAFKAVHIVNAVATVKALSYKPSGVEKNGATAK